MVHAESIALQFKGALFPNELWGGCIISCQMDDNGWSQKSTLPDIGYQESSPFLHGSISFRAKNTGDPELSSTNDDDFLIFKLKNVNNFYLYVRFGP